MTADVQSQDRPQARAGVSGPAAAVQVLVVDDDALIRQLLSECLRATGMAVTEAANGVQCLRAVEAASFDVIFMDIVMPEKDGLETTAELRRMGIKSWIIVISSQKKVGDVMLLDAAKALGADDAIHKPFNVATVARDVVTLLEKLKKDPARALR
ncbi:MAG: response regulator [Rhodospirillaceae bacterium]|nr:response regulator [Rhodospirillaceae bacterium]